MGYPNILVLYIDAEGTEGGGILLMATDARLYDA